MCTAISYRGTRHYFGRNLDIEKSYREQVTILPRHFPLPLRAHSPMEQHFAMVGMTTMAKGYPLFYDAANEHGLSMAGLNFPHSAHYMPVKAGKYNITPFELIPWVLGSCRTAGDAAEKLRCVNLLDMPFSDSYPSAPLHWLLADSNRAFTIEPGKNGLRVYENPVGVLTNEPPFPYHMDNLQNYLHLSNQEPENHLTPSLPLKAYYTGMGAMGLPGDFTSPSRFVKTVFLKENSPPDSRELGDVNQVFHILGAVSVPAGAVKIEEKYETTLYSSCCDTEKGIYYYTTYDNSQITGIRMGGIDLNGAEPVSYPLNHAPQVRMEN